MEESELKMKTRTYVSSDDGNTYAIDTVEHEGGLWLVPAWLSTPYPHMQRPARLIRMDSLPHRHLGEDFLGSGLSMYALDGPIPKAVLFGSPKQSTPQFDVLEAPDLLIRR
jgi:hypothetical protein